MKNMDVPITFDKAYFEVKFEVSSVLLYSYIPLERKPADRVERSPGRGRRIGGQEAWVLQTLLGLKIYKCFCGNFLVLYSV